MKKSILFFVLFSIACIQNTFSQSAGYKVGDVIKDFSAKNVDGKMIHTTDYSKAKGYVVVFTCNTCPYAQMYEDRIVALGNKLDKNTWPLIAINSNDKGMSPGDAYDKMQARAKDHRYGFPYIYDESQEIVRAFGASRTPHFYVLDANKKVRYIGALDDNAEDAKAVKINYVESAIKAIQDGKDPNPSFTRAVGCGIKKRPA